MSIRELGWIATTSAVALAVLGCTAGRHADDAGTGALDDAGGGAFDANRDVGPRDDVWSEFGCRSVDVLFVIDDSASMADQQAALIASFDGFVQGMRDALSTAIDYHVGVVTSDAYSHNAMGCRAIGDLVTATGGPGLPARTCDPFPSGGRYLTGTDPDLPTSFSCIANVGVGGADDERMARALLDATDPANTCNTGFLRADSVLVLVLITDEDDVRDGCTTDLGIETCLSYGSGGTPDEWVAELATHHDPALTVVLSLLGLRGDNPCGAVPASQMLHFTHAFGMHGHEGDVCAASYDGFFQEAVPIIGGVCNHVF